MSAPESNAPTSSTTGALSDDRHNAPKEPVIMVMVPTFNERENLNELAAQILALPLRVQLLIVDDNSPDGTGALADALAAGDERVLVVHRYTEKGRASAGLAGFRAALTRADVDLVIEMDADFSHDPHDIPRLVAPAQQYDVVIGSRYVPGGQSINCTPRNVAQSRIINFVNRALFGLTVRDSSGGFKCYRRRVLETISLDDYVSTEFSVGVETLVKCQAHGFSMIEIPITFRNRTRGESKANLHVLVEYPRTVLRLALKSRRGILNKKLCAARIAVCKP
jgi:dolichol-phosphate mannosyltransferase